MLFFYKSTVILTIWLILFFYPLNYLLFSNWYFRILIIWDNNKRFGSRSFPSMWSAVVSVTLTRNSFAFPVTHAFFLAGEPRRTAIGTLRRRSARHRSSMVALAIVAVGIWKLCVLRFGFCVEEREGNKMNEIGNGGLNNVEMEHIRRHHRHEPGENQCGSALVKHIRAPVPQVFLFILF